MLGKLDPFEIDLQGGDSTKRGWLGALLGAVAEVGEAGSSERSGLEMAVEAADGNCRYPHRLSTIS